MMKRQKIIFISGPSCSGKSTIANQFSDEMFSYIEDIDKNDYISKINSNEEFNAFKSQLWFIKTIYNFLKLQPSGKDIIIDQSPEAITYTYSKYFLDKNLITQQEFLLLEDELHKIQSLIKNKGYLSFNVLLSAQTKDLYDRAKKRDKNNAMQFEWFDEINQYFKDYYKNNTSIININTSGKSSNSVIEALQKIIPEMININEK